MRQAFLAAIAVTVVSCGRWGFDGLGDGSTIGGPGGINAGANIAFVTSTEFPDGNLGGITGADQECMEHAAAAGLPGTYVAWVSDTSVNAIDRLAGARGWIRVDGMPLADMPAELTRGEIRYPLVLDENGSHVGDARVLTATDTTGLFFGTTGFGSCASYSEASSNLVLSGTASAGGGSFTGLFTSDCQTPHRLYCFGVDEEFAVTTTPEAGRLAFVSATDWLPGGGAGILDADSTCQADAVAAGRSGTFLALLATADAPASARFNLDGGPWVRPDGTPLAATATDFVTGNADVSLNQAADGSWFVFRSAWYGSFTPDTTAGGLSCGDWSLTTGSSYKGRATLSGALQLAGFSHPCSSTNAAGVYCLEQ